MHNQLECGIFASKNWAKLEHNFFENLQLIFGAEYGTLFPAVVFVVQL